MFEIYRTIGTELRAHAPFTIFGTATGIAIMAAVAVFDVPRAVSSHLFWLFHPIHVVLSALVTAGMYRRHGGRDPRVVLVIGYVGAVGIATLSDSLIPYIGEWLLDMPNKGLHLGFIEKWWLVNPLALFGVALAYVKPPTKMPHAGHVLLSTWASLFHIVMALGEPADVHTVVLVAVFLFAAVWVPCCASDIVFPLLFSRTAGVKTPRAEDAETETAPHGGD